MGGRITLWISIAVCIYFSFSFSFLYFFFPFLFLSFSFSFLFFFFPFLSFLFQGWIRDVHRIEDLIPYSVRIERSIFHLSSEHVPKQPQRSTNRSK